INVGKIVSGISQIPLNMRKVDRNQHGTVVTIWDLNRSIHKKTLETVRIYLGSMYRFDIRNQKLLLLVDGNPVQLPEELEFAKSADGTIQKEPFDILISQKPVRGWFGVLQSGGRKFGGFSLFQHDRQIKGYPDAWKPRAIFGGIDDEGSNTLIAQRLTGEIILDGFDVSHTKDAILFT